MRLEDYSLPIWRQWHQTSGLGTRNDYVPFKFGFPAGVEWAKQNHQRSTTPARSRVSDTCKPSTAPMTTGLGCAR